VTVSEPIGNSRPELTLSNFYFNLIVVIFALAYNNKKTELTKPLFLKRLTPICP
jgi:hypothetical protein